MKKYKKILIALLISLFMIFIFATIGWYISELYPVKKSLNTLSAFDVQKTVEQSDDFSISITNTFTAYSGHSEFTEYSISSSEKVDCHISVQVFESNKDASDTLEWAYKKERTTLFYKSFVNQNGIFIQFEYMLCDTPYYTTDKLAYIQMDNIVIVCEQDDWLLFSTRIGKTMMKLLTPMQTEQNTG